MTPRHLITVGVLLSIAFPVLLLVAIWTGDGRWGGTAAVDGITAAVVLLVGGAWATSGTAR